MAVLVKALGYYSHKGTKGLAKLKEHLKYLEHGKEHPNTPVGFSADRNVVSRQDFLRQVAEQPGRGVIAHKLVISLSQDERDRLGVDMRQLVRVMMDEWSQRLGRPLSWIAFEHRDQGHPHVHVVVGGYARDRQVGVFERDLAALKACGEREKDRQASLERVVARTAERPDHEHELGKILCELGHLLTRSREHQHSKGRS